MSTGIGMSRCRWGRWLRALLVAPVTVGLALAFTSMTQGRLDAERRMARDEELLYLPNEKLLGHFTAGLHSVAADLLWLKCIQYTAQEFHSQEHKFTWLDHICKTIVRLDPYFTGEYKLGGTLLAAIGNYETALYLKKRGLLKRPDRWELPLEIAKTYILNRREEPSSPALASYYLIWTAELTEGQSREFFMQWAYNLQRVHDLTEMGRRIWENIRNTSSDPFMQELAERKIILLDLHVLCSMLTEAAHKYRARFGEPPTSVDDLVQAGFFDKLPVDPLGGSFFVDSEGQVKSTTLLDDEVAQRLRHIRAGLDQFKNTEGRCASSLEELVDSGMMRAIPLHPYPDRNWVYDPATGVVE